VPPATSPGRHTFTALDGTRLAYQMVGDGEPLVCLPGGPMQAADYLGGLSAHRQLIRLDLRGTGDSAIPADPASYRCDRLVDDVECLRGHLGVERLDLLGHSAGANLAELYAARHPDRVGKLLLITPSVAAVGVTVSTMVRLATAGLRRNEPWFPMAFAALQSLVAGDVTPAAAEAVTPLFHGRWDEAAQTRRATDQRQRNDEAAAAFRADGAFDPPATRAALAQFVSPVLVLAGALDVNSPPPAMAELATLFPLARVVIQPGAEHYPWADDPDRFVATLATFLR